jgi:phosphoglycerate dehydrogenase-like enzyme
MQILCANWIAGDKAKFERRLFADIDFVVAPASPGASSPLSKQLCQTADAVINYSATQTLAAEPAAFDKCRIAIRAGVGFDNMDVKGWGARGIPVCNVPDYGTTEVADHAIALMLTLVRGTTLYSERLTADTRSGWSYAAAPLISRLRGATFGVIGLGRIGLAAARRAAAFDMRVVFYDPYLPNGTELSVGYERVHALAELMAMSDVVSVHAPLSDETKGLLGRAVLAAAKPGVIVINTARGAIIDLDALAEALKSGKVAGAGLDVLPKEPADPDHPLIKAWRAREAWIDGRLALTPHAAFYSPAAMEDLRRKAIEVAVAYLRDGRLTNCVNDEFLKRDA